MHTDAYGRGATTGKGKGGFDDASRGRKHLGTRYRDDIDVPNVASAMCSSALLDVSE